VAVLVTEGTVSVDRRAASDVTLPHEESILVAGQRTVIFTDGTSARPVVAVATPGEVEHDLAWQALRLEFAEQPLAQVVEEFNRHNTRKLAIGDAAAGAVRVGGTFRADNVDAFVRLLEAGFRVTATQREDGVTVLTSGR
jgi:transmembrane sensor